MRVRRQLRMNPEKVAGCAIILSVLDLFISEIAILVAVADIK
jgi:hypothetical protein